MADGPVCEASPTDQWRERNALNIAHLRAEARGPFMDFERKAWAAGFQVVIVPPVIRTDAQEFALYRSGRTFANGVWTLTDPSKWRTNAMNALQTPHGERRRAAADWAFLVNGEPDWADSHPWKECLRDIGEPCGLVWGGHFHHPDLGHLELKGWSELPLVGSST